MNWFSTLFGYLRGAKQHTKVATGPIPVIRPMPSSQLIALVKHYESFEPAAYWDPHGQVWTIGWGNTYYLDGTKVKAGDVINEHAGEGLLTAVLQDKMQSILVHLDTPLATRHIDALTSFLYNVGPGQKGVKDGLFTLKSGRPSTLWSLVADNRLDEAADEFPKWNKSGGMVLRGLQKRRRAEQLVWDGVDVFAAIKQAEKEYGK
jgi:lysozyme